jgi:hypothetical protein
MLASGLISSLGAGTVTSISQGPGIYLSTSPIIATGPIAAALASPGTSGLKITCAGGGNTVVIANSGRSGKFQVIVTDSNNQSLLLLAATFPLTVNIAASGALGLDTGSVAASTWYYIWIIAKADGTTSAVFSLSNSLPTFPTGYLFSILVGAVFTDGSKHTSAFTQLGNQVSFAPINVFSALAVTTPGTYQSVSLSSIVPNTALSVGGIIGGTTVANASTMGIAGDASKTGVQEWNLNSAGQLDGSYGASAGFTDIPLITAQTVYWTSYQATANSRLDISSYKLNSNLG